MRQARKRRLVAVLFLVAGVGVTTVIVFYALRENFNLFYEPSKIVSGEAPIGRRIRGGGMVAAGSVMHDAQGLGVSFVLTDYKGADFTVRYSGILPGLFREGQGILVVGELDDTRTFQADEVLAKHDESYMPPELIDMASDS